jgi:hypothetical protein
MRWGVSLGPSTARTSLPTEGDKKCLAVFAATKDSFSRDSSAICHFWPQTFDVKSNHEGGFGGIRKGLICFEGWASLFRHRVSKPKVQPQAPIWSTPGSIDGYPHDTIAIGSKSDKSRGVSLKCRSGLSPKPNRPFSDFLMLS